jgi:hypothetical protein
LNPACASADSPETQTSSASRACSSRKAAPRWLIAFFSAIDSSAMVRPGVASGMKSGS